jgi:hypothetical protein
VEIGKLGYSGKLLVGNRSGLIVDEEVFQQAAALQAECEAILIMLELSERSR